MLPVPRTEPVLYCMTPARVCDLAAFSTSPAQTRAYTWRLPNWYNKPTATLTTRTPALLRAPVCSLPGNYLLLGLSGSWLVGLSAMDQLISFATATLVANSTTLSTSPSILLSCKLVDCKCNSISLLMHIRKYCELCAVKLYQYCPLVIVLVGVESWDSGHSRLVAWIGDYGISSFHLVWYSCFIHTCSLVRLQMQGYYWVLCTFVHVEITYWK